MNIVRYNSFVRSDCCFDCVRDLGHDVIVFVKFKSKQQVRASRFPKLGFKIPSNRPIAIALLRFADASFVESVESR